MMHAKYIIADTFKITGRGIVFAGYITEGTIKIGDIIEFTAFNNTRKRKITGIEGIRKSQPDKVNTGLMIQCTDDNEIEKLKNWKPHNQVAIIFKETL